MRCIVVLCVVVCCDGVLPCVAMCSSCYDAPIKKTRQWFTRILNEEPVLHIREHLEKRKTDETQRL
jgi:hypothetical protein